ncbi:MAG: shikimate dehydrogenase [Sterolibacteriaceae bacterium]|uniref:Shikimate dehydrogenase (NADP(+)) n=1 Tax=Candidatus Methylophosphatis roskildensis TaxID=2899263 RepID=A0A9D7HQ12_9PROT|nr:shikimate dehydrogenase [Candidatus Methylophosphatis roskildensis]
MTDRYAVVGNPIAHSKSPRIHAAFARQTAQDLSYEAILAPLDGFAASMAGFIAAGGCGMNVTLPFKLEAFALAECHTARAEAARAANTLKFEPGQILGDNTDGAGLVADLVRNLDCPIAGQRVLLLGAGGAARGVVLPLLGESPASLTVANRTPSGALALRDTFAAQANVAACSFAGLAGQQFDLVINATSASLAGQAPAIPPGLYAPGSTAYDMMYGRGMTAFLASAQSQGASRLADGLGMLVEQAAESFLLWRGVRPDTRLVLADLAAELHGT